VDGTDSAPFQQPNNVWSVKDDGTAATPLTNLVVPAFAAHSESPVYSPDGTKIAFQSARAFDGSNNHDVNQVANIWVMNADGSGATALTHLTHPSADCTRPAWSPDGKKIAYTSARALDGSDDVNPGGSLVVTNVWSINADGTNNVPLTDDNSIVAGGTTNSSDPVWSPDGSRITFVSVRAVDGTHLPNTNSTPNLWIMNSADGSSRRPLTFYTAAGIRLTGWSWLPNGSRVLYSINAALVGDATAIPNIWSVNPDVFPINPTALTKFTNVPSVLPSPSPDGSKIAFLSFRALDGSDTMNTNNTGNIWVMNADGSSPAHLTSLAAMGPISIFGGSGANRALPAWSRDGSKIAFVSGRAFDGSDTPNTNFVMNLWVMNANGTGQKPVTKVTAVNADCTSPNWHP
jgi:Tol biopolymer transport system component